MMTGRQRDSQAARVGKARAPRSSAKKRPALDVERILWWADAHRTATGRWPNGRSGPVRGVDNETWLAIDMALRRGHRGLPGGSSLAQLLDEERGVRERANPEAPAERLRAWEAETFPPHRPRRQPRCGRRPRGTTRLTVDLILSWADAHRAATGQWPRHAVSGPVRDDPNLTWSQINRALNIGSRGLPGGTTLANLLQAQRGVRNVQNLPPLDIEQILAWADAHRTATGHWPLATSGPVGAAGEGTWMGVDMALRQGLRGLPGGSSLAQLLGEHRRVPSRYTVSPLTVAQILSWAEAHHAATGRWPQHRSGPVREDPELTWDQVNTALITGYRGLPGGTTLAGLLQEQRGVRNKRNRPCLDIEQILAWADDHRQATGEYPDSRSGPVRAAPPPGETWAIINSALSHGRRGLPGGSSLSRLLVEHRGHRGPLTTERILTWADAHHEATGHWPTRESSGPLRRVPGETWPSLDAALKRGYRGLPGGSSLAQLLGEHRRAPNRYTVLPLTVAQILSWAETHHAATGRWPSFKSGPVLHAQGEHWKAIETALRKGFRGLPGDQSVGRLIRAHAGPDAYRTRPRLTVEQILAWADAHHEATGSWPITYSGPVRSAPGESWKAISLALYTGHRGLPGGSSLARLLAKHRGVPIKNGHPRLTVAQILAWADDHFAATGRWPTATTSPVEGMPGEKWANLDAALQHGRRGLPRGKSLSRLIHEHRGASALAARATSY
jgi:hypothetical protein